MKMSLFFLNNLKNNRNGKTLKLFRISFDVLECGLVAQSIRGNCLITVSTFTRDHLEGAFRLDTISNNCDQKKSLPCVSEIP